MPCKAMALRPSKYAAWLEKLRRVEENKGTSINEIEKDMMIT